MDVVNRTYSGGGGRSAQTQAHGCFSVCRHWGLSSSSVPCWKCPLKPQILPKRSRFPSRGRSKPPTHTLLCSLSVQMTGGHPGARARRVTGPPCCAAIHAGPTIPVSICSCFPQDTSLMTQITAQGQENAGAASFLKCPLLERCPVAETEDGGSWAGRGRWERTVSKEREMAAFSMSERSSPNAALRGLASSSQEWQAAENQAACPSLRRPDSSPERLHVVPGWLPRNFRGRPAPTSLGSQPPAPEAAGTCLPSGRDSR